ncbi:MAG: HdeD family acid-resistance protein, partial [Gemmatimonadaceae bacterium]
ALRGVIALIFGLLTLSRPGITLGALILLFGFYALADGIFNVISAIANRHGERHWVALLLGGLFGIAAGIFTFAMPHLTAVILLYFIAFWAILSGGSEIAAAIRLRKVISNEWLLGLVGVMSIVFGFYLLHAPGIGALAVTIWIGAYATVLGIALLVFALRLRSWDHHHQRPTFRPT